MRLPAAPLACSIHTNTVTICSHFPSAAVLLIRCCDTSVVNTVTGVFINRLPGPGVCSDTALYYLSTEQLSRLPFVHPPHRRVGEAEQRRLPGTKRDELEPERRGSGLKQFLGVSTDEQNSQKRCPKPVVIIVLQDRRFEVSPYFKHIVLKCGKVQFMNIST